MLRKTSLIFIIFLNLLLVFTCGVILLKKDDNYPFCTGRKNSSETRGLCIFGSDCRKLNGSHVDYCIDGMMIKSCCLLPVKITQQLTQTITLTNISKTGEMDKSNNLLTGKSEIEHHSKWLLIDNNNAKLENISKNRTKIDSFQLNHNRLILGLNLHLNTSTELVCGRSYHKYFPMSKIVGGHDSQFAKWPWQVSLRHKKQTVFAHSCGAVLLSNKWIMTAAHCVYNKSTSDLMVRLGEFDQSNNNERLTHLDSTLSTILLHPHYNERTFQNDIALIRLSDRITFRANILPVCLPSIEYVNNTYTDITAVVTGWGQLFSYGSYPNKLQEVNVTIISNEQCTSMFQRAIKLSTISQNILCAGVPDGGKDSCEGDSGGPLVVQRKDDRWEIAGIISWGVECAKPEMPGVYTRVVKFIDWINAIINE